MRIEFDAVLEQAAGGAIGRPHVARAMIAEGWAVDFRDAFDRYLGNGRPAFVAKDRLAVVDAIALIHDAGGLAILAHPGAVGHARAHRRVRRAGHRRRRGSPSEPFVRGHRAPRWRWSSIFRSCRAAARTGTAPPEGPRTLGMMRVPAEWLERQDGRVRARAA